MVVCRRCSSILWWHMLRRALWSHVLGRRGPSWHGHVSSHRLPWWSSYNPWRWDCTRKGPIVLRSWCFSHQIVVQRQGINLENRFADERRKFCKNHFLPTRVRVWSAVRAFYRFSQAQHRSKGPLQQPREVQLKR